jgi:hypothetical protein
MRGSYDRRNGSPLPGCLTGTMGRGEISKGWASSDTVMETELETP